jgi:hypothetical protein
MKRKLEASKNQYEIVAVKPISNVIEAVEPKSSEAMTWFRYDNESYYTIGIKNEEGELLTTTNFSITMIMTPIKSSIGSLDPKIIPSKKPIKGIHYFKTIRPFSKCKFSLSFSSPDFTDAPPLTLEINCLSNENITTETGATNSSNKNGFKPVYLRRPWVQDNNTIIEHCTINPLRYSQVTLSDSLITSLLDDRDRVLCGTLTHPSKIVPSIYEYLTESKWKTFYFEKFCDGKPSSQDRRIYSENGMYCVYFIYYMHVVNVFIVV